MRRRLFEIMEEGAGTDAFSRYFDTFILLLIGLITMIGIAMFALPAGIIASGFEQELER